MGALGVIVLPNGTREAASSPIYVGVWSLLYVISGFAFLRRPKFNRQTLILLAFSLLALTSSAWSPQPLTTATNATMMIANVLFIVQSRANIGSAKFLRVMQWTLVALVTSGTVMALLGLDAAMYVDAHQRTTYLGTQPIRGLFSHKITAGVFATIAAVIAMVTIKGAGRIIMPAVLLLFVLATGSTGALALFAVSVVVAFLVVLSLKLRLKSDAIVTGLVAVMFIGALFVGTLLPVVLEALGADASLTGRAELWGWAWNVIAERPIIGYGYYGYIGSDTAKQAALSIPRFVYYDVPHFHNSYLQTLVDLGIVGLSFQMFILLYALKTHYHLAYYTHDRIHLAYAIVLMVIIAAGMGMHTLFQYNYLLTLFVFRAFVSDRAS